MSRSVLVVGHADADGHVIAEQTRRNLNLVPSFEVNVVVDPTRTQGHRTWTSLERLWEIEAAEIVIFVDLMFSPTAFVPESEGLARCAQMFPDTLFIVVDHHPLPERRLLHSRNVRVAYRPDVFECTIGPRTGLMVIAALDENQYETVRPILREDHEILAQGLRRAAAWGSELPGPLLMSLLRARRWDLIHTMGLESKEYHRLVRGRRPIDYSPVGCMVDAIATARQLAQRSLKGNTENVTQRDSGSVQMPFDVDDQRFEREAPEAPLRASNVPAAVTDLGMLVTLLEVAALTLTDRPGATFTKQQLLAEMRDLAGEAVEINEREVNTVFEKVTFITSAGRSTLCLR